MRSITAIVSEYRRYLIYLLLIVFAVVGLRLAGTYGLGWDEPTSDHAGRVTLAYLQHREDPNDTLASDFMHFYGVVFELPLAYVEETLHLESRDTYVFRHAATFIFFLIGAYFFYLLCLRRFKSVWLPLLGVVFLLASPPIFSAAFFNSKDIPALVFFIISIFTLSLLIEKPTFNNALWHALACALLIDTRLPGIFVVAITFVFFAGNFVFVKTERVRWKFTFLLLVMYSIVLAGFVLLFWPFLWEHPVANFLAALDDMSHFSRQANLVMLFEGRHILASQTPWDYIPVWILVTTPLVYIALFFTGLLARIMRFFRSFFVEHGVASYYRTWRPDLVVLAWFFLPILAVIVLHSIVYDGWRQMYFVYPAFLYVALVGIEELIGLCKRLGIHTLTRWLLPTIIAFGVLHIAWFMVRSHPYQNVYFNAFVGGVAGAIKNYEVDYWGLTFREGLEYIAAHDPEPVITVYIAGGASFQTIILKPELQKRFVIVDQEKDFDKVKYILSNYRFQEYDAMPWDAEYYSIQVDGAKIMTIFKNQ